MFDFELKEYLNGVGFTEELGAADGAVALVGYSCSCWFRNDISWWWPSWERSFTRCRSSCKIMRKQSLSEQINEDIKMFIKDYVRYWLTFTRTSGL